MIGGVVKHHFNFSGKPYDSNSAHKNFKYL